MTENEQLIHDFYSAFAAGDIERMVAYYADDVIFHDPAFGQLNGENARDMWRMLYARSKGQLSVSWENIQAHPQSATATWAASYLFGKSKRKVLNRIGASFEIKNGKIVRHTDHFDIWKWSMQALGASGWCFGWTQWMHRRIQERSRKLLADFQAKKG